MPGTFAWKEPDALPLLVLGAAAVIAAVVLVVRARRRS